MALCVYCYCFRPNDSGALISSPLSDWKNIGHLLQKHLGDPHTSLHSAAAKRAESFLGVASGKQPDVLSMASSAHKQQQEKNLRMLTSVLECIKFCGQQGLALREHRFEDGANPGNFRALIDFRAQTDNILSNHLEHSPRNARYLSSGIQNELIQVCGETIRESIIHDCRLSQFFSVLADETTDVSTTEQLSICVRFVETTGSQIKLREEFLGFVAVTSTTGESIAEVILSTLEKWGLDVNLLRGQGYDGASNMSGKFRGVQAIVKSRVPSAVYLHCRAHSLNLAVVHSCDNSHVRNMFGTVQKVAVFFGESAKRYHVFKEIDKGSLTSIPGPAKLQKLCETRWSSRYDALHTIKLKWKTVLEALSTIADGGESNAHILLCSLRSFDFIVSLVIVEHFLSYTNSLSMALQKEGTNLLAALESAKASLQCIQGDRNDACFSRLYGEIKILAQDAGISEQIPRRAGRQTQRDNVQASTPEQYWRITVYYAFIDHLQDELKTRLLNHDLEDRLLVEKLLPQIVKGLADNQLDELSSKLVETYGTDLPDSSHLLHEIKRWKSTCIPTPHQTVDEALLSANEQFYPNIHMLLKLLLVLPISTATAERTFSSLRILKTWLRSTMGEERLSGLALMYIHRNITLNNEHIIKTWYNMSNRRIQLSFESD